MHTRTAPKQDSSRKQAHELHSQSYTDPAHHRDLRGFDAVNSPELVARLERMWRDGVGCVGFEEIEVVEEYAFGCVDDLTAV